MRAKSREGPSSRAASPAGRLKKRELAKLWTPHIKLAPTHLVEPPHELQDLWDFAELARSMLDDGWRGRPLLVERIRGGWLGWTGTHRVLAAKVALLPYVPVVEVQKELWVRCHGEPPRSMLSETFEDHCRLGWLKMAGDWPAVALMEAELEYGSGG